MAAPFASGETTDDSIFIVPSTPSTSPRVTVVPSSAFTRMMLVNQ